MSYRVPAEWTRVEIKVSNSRFIATAERVDPPKAAQAFIRTIRDEMPDASHHVYAFRIGHGSSISEGMSDDGEPSGTSGPPAMAVVRGSGLGDVVVVITRYFGGTKLGTGGLVSAYGAAAKAVLAELPTEIRIDRTACRLDVPYALLESSRRALAELCQQYATPVLGFVQRRIPSREEAEDATQEFFAWLINGNLPEEVIHIMAGLVAARKNHCLRCTGRCTAHTIRVLAVGVRAADHTQQQPVSGFTRLTRRLGHFLEVKKDPLGRAATHVRGRNPDLWHAGHQAAAPSRKSFANRCSTPPAA